MPNIFGLKLAPVLVATIVFWFLGFLWYGVLFMDAWMAAHGVTVDDAGGFDIYMAGGILTTLLQVIGLGLILKWRNGSGVGDAVKTALMMWVFLAFPFVMYAYLYLPAHDPTVLMIDGSHMLAGWVVSAAILTVMK